MLISSMNANKGISAQYGRHAIYLIIGLSLIGYGWLLVELRAIGRQLADDPELRTYAGLPGSDKPIANAAPLIIDNRWWRPVPKGSKQPIEFGGTIINNQDATYHNVRAVRRAYDREGRLVAKPVARCQPSTLKPGQRGECTGAFAPTSEVLWFFMDITGNREQHRSAEVGGPSD